MTVPPWHFRPLALLSLLWYAILAADYLATRYQWGPWMQVMTERQETFVSTMPMWVDSAWGVGVWVGLLGILMLAARIGAAPVVLLVSAIAIVALTAWFALFSVPTILSLAGWLGLAILVGSSLLAILLWLYARAMRRAGVI